MPFAFKGKINNITFRLGRLQMAVSDISYRYLYRILHSIVNTAGQVLVHKSGNNYSIEDIYLVKALYFIYKKNFDSALSLLEKVKMKNYEYYVPSRLYKIRSYYNMNDFERAIEELFRVKKYVSYHDEILYSIRIKYNNDLRDLKMLIDFMTGNIDINSINYYFKNRTLPRVNNWILREVGKVKWRYSATVKTITLNHLKKIFSTGVLK